MYNYTQVQKLLCDFDEDSETNYYSKCLNIAFPFFPVLFSFSFSLTYFPLSLAGTHIFAIHVLYLNGDCEFMTLGDKYIL